MIGLLLLFASAVAEVPIVNFSPAPHPCAALFVNGAEIVTVGGFRTTGGAGPVVSHVLKWLSPNRALFFGAPAADSTSQRLMGVEIVDNVAVGARPGANVNTIFEFPKSTAAYLPKFDAAGEKILITYGEIGRFGRVRNFQVVADPKTGGYAIGEVCARSYLIDPMFQRGWDFRGPRLHDTVPVEHFAQVLDSYVEQIKSSRNRRIVVPRVSKSNKFILAAALPDDTGEEFLLFARRLDGAQASTQIGAIRPRTSELALFTVPGRLSLNFSPTLPEFPTRFYALQEFIGSPIQTYSSYEPGQADDQRLGSLELVRISLNAQMWIKYDYKHGL